MRKLLMFMALALMAFHSAPNSAEARSYHGYHSKISSYLTSSHSSSRYGYRSSKRSYRSKWSRRARRNYRRSRYTSRGRSYRSASSRKRSRRRHSHGRASASVSCLTPSARALLNRIRSRFGNVQIISTCRPGARIATTGKISKHATGHAIDFRVPGSKAAVVAWLRRNHRSGGIMTYSDMDHIHVDIGYRFVALNRYSGKS